MAADLEVKRWQRIGLAERDLNQYLAKTKEGRAKAKREWEQKIAAAESALAKYDSKIDQHIKAWSEKSSQGTEWEVLDFESLTSSFGAKLERQDDGSIFASGKNGRGNYDLVAGSELSTITGIRVEALTDDRLPKKGPGRADDGNFVLSELKFQWADVTRTTRQKLQNGAFKRVLPSGKAMIRLR